MALQGDKRKRERKDLFWGIFSLYLGGPDWRFIQENRRGVCLGGLKLCITDIVLKKKLLLLIKVRLVHIFTGERERAL